jgi:hypothetical protein
MLPIAGCAVNFIIPIAQVPPMVTNDSTNTEKQVIPSRDPDLRSLITKSEYSIYPVLNQREKHFIECVRSTIDSLGAADYEELSSRLLHDRSNGHKLFSSQREVDDVEETLCEKQAIKLIRRQGASGYCIEPSEDYLFETFKRYRSRNDVTEFIPNMPSLSLFSQIQRELIRFIKKSYSQLSPKEVQVLKYVVYGMLDGRCLSVNVDVIAMEALEDADGLFSSWTEATETIKSLLKRGVLQAVYAGYEIANKDGTKRRTMPTPHITLEAGFGKLVVNHINYIYGLQSDLNLHIDKRSQYLITK